MKYVIKHNLYNKDVLEMFKQSYLKMLSDPYCKLDLYQIGLIL